MKKHIIGLILCFTVSILTGCLNEPYLNPLAPPSYTNASVPSTPAVESVDAIMQRMENERIAENKKQYDEYYNKLIPFDDKRLAQRYQSLYANKEKDYINYSGGFMSLLRATKVSIVGKQEVAASGNTLDRIKGARDFYHEMITAESELWGEAIHGKSSFNLALSTFRDDCQFLGAYSDSDQIYNKIKSQVANLSEASYPHTYKLYSILAQLKEIATEPRGSLLTFNETANSVLGDFQKECSLAELESAKHDPAKGK